MSLELFKRCMCEAPLLAITAFVVLSTMGLYGLAVLAIVVTERRR